MSDKPDENDGRDGMIRTLERDYAAYRATGGNLDPAEWARWGGPTKPAMEIGGEETSLAELAGGCPTCHGATGFDTYQDVPPWHKPAPEGWVPTPQPPFASGPHPF